MNILFLTYQTGLAGSTYSIAALAEGLAKRGHAVFAGCRTPSILFSMLEGTPVVQVPIRFEGRFNSRTLCAIRDVVRQKNIGIINAQSSIDRYASIASNWRYRLGAAVVHTRRQIPLSSGGWLQGQFYTRGTAGIVAVSGGVRDGLVRLGIPKRHIRIIYNGTSPEKYRIDSLEVRRMRDRFGIGEDTGYVIGCVSRRKKQHQILEACTLLETPVTLFFAGIDRNADDDAIISRFKVPHRVIYAGVLPPAEVIHCIPLLNVKVLASTTEGLSQALLEAMALGVPVIATDAPGNNELIHDGENGFLFADGDAVSLAEIFRKLISGSVSTVTITANARRTALEEFSIDRTVDEYERYFTSIYPSGRRRSAVGPSVPLPFSSGR